MGRQIEMVYLDEPVGLRPVANGGPTLLRRWPISAFASERLL